MSTLRATARASAFIWGPTAVAAAIALHGLYRVDPGWAPITIVTAMAVAAAVRPYQGLLVFAGLAPLASIIFLLTRSGYEGLHFEEAVTLAFIAGWSARRAFERRPLAVRRSLAAAVAALVVATIASALVTTAVAVAENPAVSPGAFLGTLLGDYLLAANVLMQPMLLWEGLILLLIAADTCAGDEQRRDRVTRMFVAGATGVALLNLLRLALAAAAQDEAWAAFLKFLATVRVSVQYGDVNAAGSYFALAMVVALALTLRERRWAASGVVTALGLWISGSRTALAAVPLALLVVPVAMNRRFRTRQVLLPALLVLAAMAAAAWWWYPEGRNEAIVHALDYRLLTARAAVDLTISNPWFGVGLGRFFELAEPYVGRPENAHNNFLQILAELGLPGLVLFVTVIGLALAEAGRNGTKGIGWGLYAGIAAFLLTCLAGHPLLIPPVAYGFWIAVGLAAVPSAPAVSSKGWTVAAWVLVAFFIVTLPFRITTEFRRADREHVSAGLSKWQHAPDGVRYRWAGGRSSFFVRSSAEAVRFRLRHGGNAPATIEVRILVDGRQADAVLLEQEGDWRPVRILLARPSDAAFAEIELQVGVPGSEGTLDAAPSDTGGVLMVSRAEVEDERQQ